jgi:predicted aldo/keto reductase-like oxidoreductase
VRFAGLSSHGPSRDTEDSMEKVLCAAALDGRFDVMLLVYNFMNEKAGNTILKTCKEKNVGTTAMKTAPGVLSFEKYDPLNPTAAQKNHLQQLQQRYKSAEETEEKMLEWVQEQQEEYDNSKPFIEKYNIGNEEQLKIDSIRWVLSNPEMHAACISFVDFDSIDKIIPFSGLPLGEIETGYIDWYKSHFNDQYCRHGCNMCMSECPHQIPVSTIMRYAYYFKNQNWEKESMAKYQRLGELNGTVCENCPGPCMQACEYKINIPAQLQAAHQLLTLA